MGPMFGEATRRLPRLGPRRAVVETPERRGLRAAIVELGGLPDDEDDDLPPPPSFRRGRRAGPRRETSIADARPLEIPAGGAPDIGVVEPPEWTPGRARVPGSTQGPP